MSKSQVLFTHSYFLRFDPKQWKLQQPYPPLGTLYAGAVLREAGYSVALHDTMFSHGPEELLKALETHAPKYLVIYDDGFNYLTKMCLTNMREAAFTMSRMAKDAGCTVIICSSDSTDNADKYLQAGADFVITGEGEITLRTLLDNLEQNAENLSHVQDITYLINNSIAQNPPRPVLTELDSLPVPAWDLVDMDAYRSRWLKHYGYFSLNMATTRGCPYKCNWCAKPIYGNRYNNRSPEHVVAELRYLVRIHGATHIWFCDDIFGLKPGWLERFEALVKVSNLEFRFKIQSRADLLVKGNTIVLLARAGCEAIWMGAESGSQKILDAMDKGIEVSQVHTATSMMKAHGIKPSFFLQFGYLGETAEDIQATVNMLMKLMPDDIGISVSYPLPGTKFYEKIKDTLTVKTNWTDSDEMAMMFRNNFKPYFYKQLHRFVHKKFRRQQGFNALKAMLKNPFIIDYSTLRKAASVLYYIPATLLEAQKLKKVTEQ
ncbi:MAG: B12-binding domain-containing radical SAM protein [Bacteroidota bacterium]|nr:B12-binding domain-containing radical SAM protein [Bacteroidota bacterium]